MASDLAKAFGHSSSGFKFGALQEPKQPSHGHGILHNLLQDAIDTAKGLPMGVVMTAEHPIRTFKAVGQSYADMYGHGFGHFWHEFHAHPLQPLIDAVSVPLMLAGGAGAGLKTAAFVSEIGHGAELGDALVRASKLTEAGDFAGASKILDAHYRAPRLQRAADRFRKGTEATTRMVETPLSGVSLPRSYSSNLFRRALTKGSDAILERTVGRVQGLSKGERMLAQDVSRRAAATASLGRQQARLLRAAEKASKRGATGVTAQAAGEAIIANFRESLLANAHWVSEEDAAKIAASGHNAARHYTFLEVQPARSAFLEKKAGQTVERPVPDGHVAVVNADTGEIQWHEPWLAKELLQTKRLSKVPEHEAVHPASASALDKVRTAAAQPVTDETALFQPARADMPRVAQTKQDVYVGHPPRAEQYGSNDHKLLGFSKEQEAEFIRTLGEEFSYTNDVSRAVRNSDGKVAVVRHGVAEQMRRDIEGTSELMKSIWRNPVAAWKVMILGFAPRYLVNNVIGNAGMYAAATNPLEFTRGVLEAIKSARGPRAAARAERQMGTEMDAILKQYLPDDIVLSHFGFLQHGALGLPREIAHAQNPAKSRIKGPLFEVTEKASYRGPQRAAIMGAISTMPQFRNLVKALAVKHDLSETKAFQLAAKRMVRDPKFRAAIEKRVTDWAGQYYHLNGAEKAITALVPFYNWDRHALRFAKEQVLSRPVQSSVLARLGALGDKESQKLMGKLPDFMKGAIPVGGHGTGILGFLLGQQVEGRRKIILTSGYNPLASAAEDAHAIAALVGGGRPQEAIGAQLNPVVSGAISGITGQRLFSGAKAPHHGVIGNAIEETFGQLPQLKLLENAAGFGPSEVTKRGDPTLYKKDIRQQLSSIFGLNERDYSPQAAARLYKQDHPQHRSRSEAAKAAARTRARKHAHDLSSVF